MSVENFESFPGLKRTLDALKPKQRATILDVFSSSTLKQRDTRDRLEVLEASLVESQTATFLNNIFTHEISTRDAYTHLSDPAAIQLFPALVDQHAKRQRFHIANTLSSVPFDQLPESAQKKINPTQTDLAFSFMKKINDWHLCKSAESMMERALEDKAVLLVNEKLLVKFNGKLSGLCLETFTTQEGYTFVEGTWYSPADRNLRATVRDAFDSGKAKLRVKAGSWQLMRPVKEGREHEIDLMEDAKSFADSPPSSLPAKINGLLRRRYRMTNHEANNA